jgi:enoyl-CoA hydratase/carnithine racemase
VSHPRNVVQVRKPSPSLWRATFDAPPINMLGLQMIDELQELLSAIESDDQVAAVVFDSADPDYFLAHWDIGADQTPITTLPPGPSGLHPWLEILSRLSRLPVVTISALRGRARGAGSEFALATDIRFASREKAVLSQFEVGVGTVAGGGPLSRLPRLVGRGRALEILLGADDFDGDTAERYGYVNRSIPDADFEAFVDAFATRVSRFDRWAIRTTKSFVNDVSLPADDEYPPQMAAFGDSITRPETQDLVGQLFEAGFQKRSLAERDLGAFIEGLRVPAHDTSPVPG